MKTKEREYVLGTHDAEGQRLGLQHRLWSDAAHALWRRAGIRPGQRVRDVGCGPGFAAFDLAQVVSANSDAGLVVGVDESPRYVAQAAAGAAARGLAKHVVAIEGDVQKLGPALASRAKDLRALGRPPFRKAFDLAWARWVLCFVPDPDAVVAGVAALLKPGGRFAVHDYFAYESMTHAPKAPAFTRVIEAVAKSWRSRGGDPDIVGRLPALFRKHGLDVTHLAVDHRVARPGDAMFTWPDTFFRGYVPLLVQYGFLKQPEADAFLAEWNARSKNPDVFVFLPPVFEVIGAKR
ncbi:MAG: methyltransferase domain-containing protein [Planctomycetia bacterium]|nr:methyltransferase domain-containing protein [Planctomycetia bacterium]